MKGLGSFLVLLFVMACLLSTSTLDDGLLSLAPQPTPDSFASESPSSVPAMRQGPYESVRIAAPEFEPHDSVSVSRNTPAQSPIPVPTIAPTNTPEPTSTPEPTPSPSPTPTGTPAPDFRGTYKVVAGDTLGTIAHKFYTTTALLAQANSIDNANRIAVGQVLKVPEVSATAPPLTPKPTAAPTPTPAPTPAPSPSSPPAPSPSPEAYTDTQMLARMIHSESHWEKYDGKIGVGQCAYDRWKNTSPAAGQSGCWNPGGAKSLSEILSSPSQFQLADYDKVCDGCHQAAKDVMNGSRAYSSYIVTNFRSTTSTDDWNNVPYIGHIGGHAFYGFAR